LRDFVALFKQPFSFLEALANPSLFQKTQCPPLTHISFEPLRHSKFRSENRERDIRSVAMETQQ